MLECGQTMGQERHDMEVLAAEVTVLLSEGKTAQHLAAVPRLEAFPE